MTLYFKQPVFQQLYDRPMAHCATLTQLADGTLLAAWFGGAFETAPDVAILAARWSPALERWSKPAVIAEVPGKALGQPVFLPRPDGELWFFYVVNMGADWTTAQPFWRRSADQGTTWSAPRQLMDYPGLMFRSRPVVLPGRIILPAYDENRWESRMLISDDDGRTWRLGDPIVTPNGNIHACIVQRSDGLLVAYLRPGVGGGALWRTTSSDRGDTWTPPTLTDLPNPNSGFDLLRLASGRLALAYNPSATLRTPLCVALADEDERWGPPRVLEDDYAEFSYPTLLQARDGRIHAVYTYRREHIHHACFAESWLSAAAAAPSAAAVT